MDYSKGVNMIEDISAVRRRALERHNGVLRTWWHYNRMLLLLALVACGTLLVVIQTERRMRMEVQQQVQLLSKAHLTNLSCYEHQRSSTVIVAAGSQKQAVQALLDAGFMADETRRAYTVARMNWDQGARR